MYVITVYVLNIQINIFNETIFLFLKNIVKVRIFFLIIIIIIVGWYQLILKYLVSLSF